MKTGRREIFRLFFWTETDKNTGRKKQEKSGKYIVLLPKILPKSSDISIKLPKSKEKIWLKLLNKKSKMNNIYKSFYDGWIYCFFHSKLTKEQKGKETL